MVTDVSFALVDAGISLEELKFYADKRISRPPGLPVPQRENESQAPKPLTVNPSTHQPQYVHDNLPPFPDRHTYTQNAAQRMPSTDYQLVREKAANQKKTAETALTRFIAKTGDSDHYCDDTEDPINKAFPLIACKPTPLSYLTALLPKDDSEYDLLEDILREKELTDGPSQAKKIKAETVCEDALQTDNSAADDIAGMDEAEEIQT